MGGGSEVLVIEESYGFDSYNQDIALELSHSLRTPIGGDNTAKVIVLESNQNHATARDTEVCTTLPASMGEGGGYVPMIVVNRRFADIRVKDTEISTTLEGGSGDGGNNLPMVVEECSTAPDAILLDHHPQDSRIGIRKEDVCQTLATNMGLGGGNVPLVLIKTNLNKEK